MSDYQVLARKYRPQRFEDVVSQEAVVTTLKNAIKFNRIAHAYLFCGPRGTGKTTLARLFAKALNCENLSEAGEPCNRCESCKEITAGYSLDVLEVDGASNRGIEEIRRIRDTVGYSSSKGRFKVYVIDEVHMLTKDAFNALLKTLEEPPPKVIFVFATTEPHKVLPTIMSRCQRFNLTRIPVEKIADKLKSIAEELELHIDTPSLNMIASRAEGGLRDAESLLDQIIAFHDGKITTQVVSDILGVMASDVFYTLDEAGKAGKLAVAFDIAETLFSQGKDLNHFLDSLIEHYRNILASILGATLTVADTEREKLAASAKLYTQESCLTILDKLIDAQSRTRSSPLSRTALETLLLQVMRTHHRVPVDFLVKRLVQLEERVANSAETPQNTPTEIVPPPVKPVATVVPPPHQNTTPLKKITETVPPSPKPVQKKAPPPPEKKPTPAIINEDPTPSPADLGITPQKKKAPPSPKETEMTMVEQTQLDTLMQFAAVELEGTLEKKQNIRLKKD